MLFNSYSKKSITKHGKQAVQYRVSSSQELIDVIIPHFEKYPLITQKKVDFILFKQVLYLMNNKEHLTQEGIQKIVNIKASINLGLSDSLKAAFPNIIPVQKLLLLPDDQKIMDPYWVSGFTEGEGCFVIFIHKSNVVQLKFQITQHVRDSNLLKSFVEYFGAEQCEAVVYINTIRVKVGVITLYPIFPPLEIKL